LTNEVGDDFTLAQVAVEAVAADAKRLAEKGGAA
jgi:hypothetical protein